MVSVEPVPPVVPTSGTFQKYGPRVDRLIFSVSGDVMTQIEDFGFGRIDIMDYAVPAGKWNSWLADPEITMGEYGEPAAIYLALNNMRWPLGHGDEFPEDWNSYPSGYFEDSGHSVDLWSNDPSSDLPVEGGGDKVFVDYDNCQRCNDSRWFRRGLSHMVNRDAQIAYMEGAAEPLTPSLFWPDMKGWEAPGLVEYDYDLVAAVACFEAGGFEDWDSDGVMEYSPGHDGVVIEELPSLQFYTRLDDDHRTYLGQLVSLDMDWLGIPHDLLTGSRGIICQRVWQLYDYDIYIEYRFWDRLPDFYAEWFMSRKDIYPAPLGDNHHRYHNKEFDIAAEQFMNATGSEAAKPYCYQMQEIIHRDAAVIPVYSYVGYVAHRTHYGNFPGEEKYEGLDWIGFVNELGLGFDSFWTYLDGNVQGYEEACMPLFISDEPGFEKGGTLRQGLILDPELLDIMDSIYRHEWLVLTRIYETLLKFNPYNSTQLIPWLSENYAVGTWEHPTEGTCSAINFTLIPNILWQDGEPMTAQDINFSFWFTRECRSTNYAYTKDYEESVIYEDTPIPGVQTIEIRFNVKSWLATYWCSGVPIIPEHIWSDEYGGPGVSGSAAYDPEDHDEVIGTGPFRFYKDNIVGRVNRVPLEYVYLEANPLYFRKYVWPDVVNASNPGVPGDLDGEVTGADFAKVTLPWHIMASEDGDGRWPPPTGAWGEHIDVNKDGKIGVIDLLEIGVNYGKPWPPPWYVDCQ